MRKKFYLSILRVLMLGVLAMPLASCEEDIPEDANHEAVDLGLSVKWATCNVGANSPEEFGGYYAWGETEVKSNYSLETYKYYLGDLNGDGETRENEEYINIGSGISGTSYDVAHVKWGDGWRMPTMEECEELCRNCSWEWTEVNGVSGQKVTGPNGNSIFLPAAGGYDETGHYGQGLGGEYWAGTLAVYANRAAWLLSFNKKSHGWDYFNASLRDNGYTVRPVKD